MSTYLARLLRAACTDATLATTFIRVAHLADGPQRLLRPAVVRTGCCGTANAGRTKGERRPASRGGSSSGSVESSCPHSAREPVWGDLPLDEVGLDGPVDAVVAGVVAGVAVAVAAR